jgi:hypothetical protein
MMAERRNSGTKMTAVARQWCGEHISTAKNNHTVIELLGPLFSVRSVPGLCNKDQNQKLLSQHL